MVLLIHSTMNFLNDPYQGMPSYTSVLLGKEILKLPERQINKLKQNIGEVQRTGSQDVISLLNSSTGN